MYFYFLGIVFVAVDTVKSKVQESVRDFNISGLVCLCVCVLHGLCVSRLDPIVIILVGSVSRRHRVEVDSPFLFLIWNTCDCSFLSYISSKTDLANQHVCSVHSRPSDTKPLVIFLVKRVLYPLFWIDSPRSCNNCICILTLAASQQFCLSFAWCTCSDGELGVAMGFSMICVHKCLGEFCLCVSRIWLYNSWVKRLWEDKTTHNGGIWMLTVGLSSWNHKNVFYQLSDQIHKHTHTHTQNT